MPCKLIRQPEGYAVVTVLFKRIHYERNKQNDLKAFSLNYVYLFLQPVQEKNTI